MRQLGQRFESWNESLRDQMLGELRNLTSQLESDWQGVSRQRYDNMLQDWERTIQGILQNGDDLGHHLRNTAQQFDEADAS